MVRGDPGEEGGEGPREGGDGLSEGVSDPPVRVTLVETPETPVEGDVALGREVRGHDYPLPVLTCLRGSWALRGEERMLRLMRKSFSQPKR